MLIDREAVALAYLDDAVRKPATVLVREPFGGIMVALLVTVYRRGGQRQVQKVGCKLPLGFSRRGAEAAIVGFGARNDVLNVRLGCAVEPGPGVGAVDDAAHVRNDLLLDGLRVRIVVGAVR